MIESLCQADKDNSYDSNTYLSTSQLPILHGGMLVGNSLEHNKLKRRNCLGATKLETFQHNRFDLSKRDYYVRDELEAPRLLGARMGVRSNSGKEKPMS